MIQPKDPEEMTQLTNRFNQEVNSLSQSENVEQIPTYTSALASTRSPLACSGDI